MSHKEYTLPNGEKLEFPDGTSKADMDSFAKESYPDLYVGQKPNPLEHFVKAVNNPTKSDEAIEESWKDYGIRNFVRDPLAALPEFGRDIGKMPKNLAGLISKDLSDKIPENVIPGIPSRKDFDYSDAFSDMLGVSRKKGLMNSLMRAAPHLGLSMAMPGVPLGRAGQAGSAVSKYLLNPAGEAISQGLLAAAASPENQVESFAQTSAPVAALSSLASAAESQSPITRILGKLLSGTAIGGLTYGAAKQAGAPSEVSIPLAVLAGGLGYKSGQKRNIKEGLDGTNYKQALDASERLGLPYMTPGEASQNPALARMESSIGKSAAGEKMLGEKAVQRTAAEQKSIKGLIDDIYDPNQLDQFKDFFYNSAFKDKISMKKLDDLRKDPIFRTAEKKVNTDPVYMKGMSGVAENSIERLDQVKKVMDDMMSSPKVTGEGSKVKKVKDSLDDFLKITDNSSKDYPLARSLAERNIARKNIENFFDKKEMTGVNFSEFLKSEKNFDSLRHHLRQVPSAQQSLDDMKLVFKNLFQQETAKQARKSGSKILFDSKDPIGTVNTLVSSLIDHFDKNAVELITNPKWSDQISKVSRLSKGEKFIKGASNLGAKLMSVYPRMSEDGPMSQENY